jgi:hypothetical protein
VNRLRAHTGPWWPYLVLIAIPAAGFILPDLLGGHLLMTGDNVQQNYPLHVLTGSMLRHGQLPLWDQYIYSGSPLLANFNAGAFYPLVGFFVILPDRVAWIATEVVLFAGIGVGMYVFLRALALSTVAGLLGAITFTFAGTVFSQVNHVDMTEGFVAIPWMLLAVLFIVRDGKWRWSVLLGAGFALVILGGAPEAMLDLAILVVLYAGLSAGLDGGRWWRVLTRGGAAAVLALSLAAIQWLPGLEAIAHSQRGAFGSAFAASGSFPTTDSLLTLVPYLFGGYGHLGQSMFFSSYNLPEVGVYVGILPLIALLVMWIPSWPSPLPARDRLTWYVIAVVGVLLALGLNTPLEHLFNSIPLYGHQRLQSRNMIDVSVVLSVLFAGWIDRRRESADRWITVDRWTALIPLGLVLALVGLAITDPNWIITAWTNASPSPAKVHTVRQAALIAAAVCALAGAVVWLRSILPARRWVPVMSLFVVLDLGFVAGTSQLLSTPPNDLVAGRTAVENYVGANLAPGGRFEVYDPQLYSEAPYGATGLPDYNVLAGLPSVGGYSSIVNATYNNVTQTHTQGELNLASLTSGQLDGLDLQDILTLPEYFLLPVGAVPRSLSDVQPVSEPAGRDPALPSGSNAGYLDRSYTYYPPARASLGAGQVGTWFFGEPLAPTRATLVFAAGASQAHLRFGTLSASGHPTWGPAVTVTAGAQRVTGTLPRAAAYGLAVQVISGRIPRHQALVTAGRPTDDQHTYELDGALSAALHPTTWHQQGSIDGHPLFVRNAGPVPFRVVGKGSQPAPAIAVLSANANVETIRLQASTPLVVVRSVAWDNGWKASVSVNGGASQVAPMSAYGLVQQVHLPAGHDVVTFRYRPAHFVVASLLSLAAALFLVAVAVVAVIRVRRRRRVAAPP